MKRIAATLLTLCLCVGLCACGGEDHIVLPTKPAQSALSGNQSAAAENQGAESGQTEESSESTEGKYPWEMEFREEDYAKFNITAPNGDKIVTYREGTIFGREARNIYEWTSGDIEDSYYYPSGNVSHSYRYDADGTYRETHYLDNGYVDLENRMTYNGTTVYYKQIEPDSTASEYFYDDNGILVRSIYKEADGYYSESYYFENGNTKSYVNNDPATGEYSEQEYYTKKDTVPTSIPRMPTGRKNALRMKPASW